MWLFKVMYLCFVIVLLFFPSDYSFAQEFELGAWCLTGRSNLNNIIDESPAHSGNYVLESDEKDLLEDLGLNYMIACTRGQGIPTTNGEIALNNYGIEKNGAFKSTLEISPGNLVYPDPYQVWTMIDSAGGPTDPDWCAAVDSGFVSMDTLHSNKTGVHSFLAGAEHQLENANRYSWLDYICESIHDNATNVKALVQDDYSAAEYLDSLFTIVDDIDIFNYHYYVFDSTLAYTGTDFQNALDDYVHSISYAQTELQDHYGDDGVPLHYITQVHVQPGLQRLTSKQEILCQNNLSLAYGAKGIVYYLYGSLTGGVYGLVDLYRNPTAQYDSLKTIHDDYQDTGKTFYEIASEFMNLTWRTGISVHDSTDEPINGMYDIYDVQSRIPDGDLDDEDSTYIEIGVLQDSANTNHYMVVNRRCLNGERNVTLTFESTSGHAYLITDIFTETEIHFLPAPADTFSYTFTLGDGEAKLLKLEDLGEFSGSISTNATWNDEYYIGGDITVESGATLSITANTEVIFFSGDAQSGGNNTSKSEIIVEGELKADDATFKHIDGTKGGWQGIFFEDGCDADSWIDGCVIEDAWYGVQTYEDISIDTTEFNNIDFAGIKVKGEAEPTVRECKIEADAIGVYIYRGSGTYQNIDFEGPFIESVGSAVYALGSDNTDFSHCEFDLATTANNGTYNKYSTSIDIDYSNMDVPGANHYYMKEVSSGPTSTVGYSYLGCNAANVDSNDFYGDVAWAYIQSYPVSSAGASWKKSAASDYWMARDMMRAKDYQGAYNLCMDLFNDAKTENRSECLQLAMQAAKKLHTFAKEEEFLKKSLKDEDAAVPEAAEVWLSILYEHTKAFDKAQAMIEETKLTGDSKLSMLFNLAAAYDDAGYDDKAVELFHQMIKEFPEEEKEVLGYLREMDRGGGNADDELGKQTAAMAATSDAVGLFPNPFNASTKIAYALETTGRVHISVYDILGRQVRMLIDEVQDSGAHVLNWDGRSSAGLPVSSGLYFIRIQTPDFSRMIKAVAVR